MCRICHCEADAQNPLLSPCYCAGSLKYVHQACLQQWLAASETRSCELCKFHFVLQTKVKPWAEWRRLEMSGVERRRLLCAILFHFVAAMCVVWSLFVLIDRAAEEMQRGLIAWPFWTKLVVVAIGFTGGAVFMYIQCRQYLQLCARWRAHNRVILVQNAPEKQPIRPVEAPVQLTAAALSTAPAPEQRRVVASIESSGGEAAPAPRSPDTLELNIRQMLALDVEHRAGGALKESAVSLGGADSGVQLSAVSGQPPMFKSMPNLSASSENLLP